MPSRQHARIHIWCDAPPSPGLGRSSPCGIGASEWLAVPGMRGVGDAPDPPLHADTAPCPWCRAIPRAAQASQCRRAPS